jgi:hypothetical protein
MSGMGSGLQAGNSTVIAAFRMALIDQGAIIVVIFGLLVLAWITLREWLPPGSTAAGGPSAPGGRVLAEPAARRVLRIGFGVLWIFDGILQAQSAMPVGLPARVIQPAAASSPGWVRHLVNVGTSAWTYHPVTAAAAAVWIQIGIGILLLVAGQGRWSRLGGLVSVCWGLIVWVFGEAFGGVFAPGLTWTYGAPGAAAFYCAAGVLIALPLGAWSTQRLGRLVLAVLGLFFGGMAVLQAWPGRGFWQGTSHGQPGTLVSMIQNMSQTSQPRFLAAWVAGFGSFTAAHGFAVNLFIVIVLAATGAALLSGQPRLVRPAVLATAAVCVADWVLVEDLGFFGGIGTDPNSMIPMALVVIGGYIALTRAPAAAAGRAAPAGNAGCAPEAGPGQGERPAQEGRPAQGAGWRQRLRPAAAHRAIGTASLGSVAAVGALAMTAFGAIPMAAASVNVAFARAFDRQVRLDNAPDPAPGTAISKSSFAVVLANAATYALRSPLGGGTVTLVMTGWEPGEQNAEDKGLRDEARGRRQWVTSRNTGPSTRS